MRGERRAGLEDESMGPALRSIKVGLLFIVPGGLGRTFATCAEHSPSTKMVEMEQSFGVLSAALYLAFV